MPLIRKEILSKKYLGDLSVVIIGVQAGLEPGLSGFAPRALLDDVALWGESVLFFFPKILRISLHG